MRRLAVFATILALAVPAVWAGTLADITLPDKVMVGDKTLVLNGMGLRTKMVFDIYVAGLYLEQKTSDPAAVVSSSQVKRVVMHFLSDKAKKKKMDAAWDEGFEANSGAKMAALKDRLAQFKGCFADMKPGDKVEMTMIPGKGTEVTFNGASKATITGDDFAQALLSVWMGAEPPTEDLKQGMLGS